MWIIEPKKFTEKTDDWLLESGYMHSQLSINEFVMKNASAIPNESSLESAVNFIFEEVGISLSTGQLLNILSLYPMQRVKLAVYGWGDTEVKDITLDVIANFMVNTRWPHFRDNVDIGKFVERLRVAARFLGYKTVGSEKV